VSGRWFVFRSSEFKTHTHTHTQHGWKKKPKQNNGKTLSIFAGPPRGKPQRPSPPNTAMMGPKRGHALYASRRGSVACAWLPPPSPPSSLRSRRPRNTGYASVCLYVCVCVCVCVLSRYPSPFPCRWLSVSVSPARRFFRNRFVRYARGQRRRAATDATHRPRNDAFSEWIPETSPPTKCNTITVLDNYLEIVCLSIHANNADDFSGGGG